MPYIFLYSITVCYGSIEKIHIITLMVGHHIVTAVTDIKHPTDSAGKSSNGSFIDIGKSLRSNKEITGE